MTRLFTLFLLLTFYISNSYGQEKNSIAGKITNADGNSIVGVHVQVLGTNLGAVSNSSGEFLIEGIEPSEVAIRLSLVGYSPVTRVVDPSIGSTVNVTMTEAITELPEIIISRSTITGAGQSLSDIPGSAHYLGLPELTKYSYTDINRILRNLPGINIQEEDGFGLRPNIGMRGTGVERSSKITLMEDGILAAPAPYAAPSAYYFPTAGRMQGVEVRKGSSQIKYGPYTTGGAINLLSTQIPKDLAANINLMAGNFGRRVTHVSVGDSFDHGGFMLETYQHAADGFKQLDNGGPTGFVSSDYLAKIRLNTGEDAKIYQSLLFKIGKTTGESDETYLGLAESDFQSTPYRRYAGSQMDRMKTDHSQYSIKYSIIPASFLDISVTAYKNDFARNWYKLDGVKYGTNSKVSISNLLDDPAAHQDEYAIVAGMTSPNSDALYVKANNRRYFSRGIQLLAGINFESEKLQHQIELGLRVHKDQEDRFQWEDLYTMDNGIMKLSTPGIPGTESNRISTADAVSAFLQYSLSVGKFSLQPGLRLEQVEMSRLDYGKTDPERTSASLNEKVNSTSALIPGIGFQYSANKTFQAFGGVHKGYAPQGFDIDDRPEASTNYELGARIAKSELRAQAVLFYTDYSNLLGADLASSGGGGTGDLFNAGEARVHGAEIEVNGFLHAANLKFPFTLAYTYTNGTFGSSFAADNEDWGTVQQGDHLPYLAKNQLTFNIGLQHAQFDINVSTKYVGVMRTAPGQGEIMANERLNDNYVIDLATNYRINKSLTAFGNISNITNQVYAVARRPAGLRPGMPRSFVLGIKATF